MIDSAICFVVTFTENNYTANKLKPCEWQFTDFYMNRENTNPPLSPLLPPGYSGVVNEKPKLGFHTKDCP